MDSSKSWQTNICADPITTLELTLARLFGQEGYNYPRINEALNQPISENQYCDLLSAINYRTVKRIEAFLNTQSGQPSEQPNPT